MNETPPAAGPQDPGQPPLVDAAPWAPPPAEPTPASWAPPAEPTASAWDQAGLTQAAPTQPAPTAWSQPPLQTPFQAPLQAPFQTPGAVPQPQTAWSAAPSGPRPGMSRGARGWLIAAGAAVVVAGVVVTIVLTTSGGSSGSNNPAAAAGPHAAAPTGKVFTHVPTNSCTLVSQATVDTYAPGTQCKPSVFDTKDLPGMITRQPRWDSDMSGGGSRFVSVDAEVTVGATANDMYNMAKGTGSKVMAGFDTIQDQHAVTGIGDAGYIYFGQSKDSGDAVIAVRDGNAVVEVTYHGSIFGSDGNSAPVAQQDAEAAVTAFAKDIISHLS